MWLPSMARNHGRERDSRHGIYSDISTMLFATRPTKPTRRVARTEVDRSHHGHHSASLLDRPVGDRRGHGLSSGPEG